MIPIEFFKLSDFCHISQFFTCDACGFFFFISHVINLCLTYMAYVFRFYVIFIMVFFHMKPMCAATACTVGNTWDNVQGASLLNT